MNTPGLAQWKLAGTASVRCVCGAPPVINPAFRGWMIMCPECGHAMFQDLDDTVRHLTAVEARELAADPQKWQRIRAAQEDLARAKGLWG